LEASMLIKKNIEGHIPSSQITPKESFLTRRNLLTGAAAVGVGALALRQIPGLIHPDAVHADQKLATVPSKYTVPDAQTPFAKATTYNNYYEFGTDKSDPAKNAHSLHTRPWTVQVTGLVKKPATLDIDAIMKYRPIESRVYRHRCVEAWSMTVPWTGFPLSQLLKIAEPLQSAKYVVFETLQDKSMPGLRSPFYPWPYIEGLAIDEAANDLAFISTGLYGKPLPPQNGGPIRLTLPWKYGFKSCKALAKVSFTDQRPVNFWQAIQPSEYGFWANVNPAVSHPRWSQARERVLGSNEMVPTQIYNGYGEFVASLYTDRKNEKLFM
jgi:methionine sulfoxide reductase catalytic subunit